MTKRLKTGIVSASLAAVLFVVIGGLNVRASSGSDGAYKQLGVYSEVLQRIRTEYVEEPNFDAVRAGALRGLLESLDGNSSYIPAKDYKTYKERRTDYKAGVGATIAKRFGYVAVVSVLPGSPAEKANLETGDIIESMEGRSTRDMSVAEVRALFRGDKGSTITMSVIKPRKAEPEKVSVTRDEYAIPGISDKMLENGIGYIKPVTLVKGKAAELAAKIKAVQGAGAKKLVLDLRNLSEGEISEGIAAANLFLDHGTIATLKGQKYTKEDFNADPAKQVTKMPVVILVNRGTAGPGEVMAAAIMDNARGEVVGDKTFGSASVTKLIEVEDGSAVILSIAKYYTPSGKAIQDTSITPNVVVADPTVADLADPDGDDNDNDGKPDSKQQQRADEQLQKAISVLKAKQG
jgi:carboxyl-terminal processing protease